MLRFRFLVSRKARLLERLGEKVVLPEDNGLSPIGVTCIYRDTGDVPLFWVLFRGCSWIFGYLFWAILGFLGIICFLFFYFFKNNPDFGVLILIFPSMTLWNCCLQGSCFYDSTVLLFLFYYACAKSSILSITAISLSSYICSAV